MGDSLFVHGGVTDAQEARLALAGLIAVHGATLLDARTGVMHGAGSTALVTGTTATAPMTVSIAPHQWVTTRGTANGPYLGSLAAATTVTIAAAPASGTRTDVVYVKQNDPTPGVPTPDTSPSTAQPIYGVLQGTVGAGKPSLATIVGAEELATVAVSAGAVRTTDGTVLITNTARQTVARGAPIPVRNQAEEDALSPFWPLMEVKRLDLGTVKVRNAANTGWQTVRYTSTTDSPFTQANLISGVTVAPSWTVSNLAFARKDGQLFANGNAGRPSWLNGETILTLPAGWRPQQQTEWLARMNSTYYLMVLETGGALRIFVDNQFGTIQGTGTGVDDTFAVIGTPTLLA